MPVRKWVVRTRLLQRLPREPGHVVWLCAPYGFGKTVLLQQWSEELRAQGWRVVWASASVGSLAPQIGRSVGVGSSYRWKLLQALLQDAPTVLVLDDLGPSALPELTFPWDGLLIGLSSRSELPWPELPKAQTWGRLLRLTADDLRFSLPEVRQLVGDDRRAYDIWERSGGWPIAVHMAALTGTLDLRTALVRGVRESLEQAEWDQLLLLSALPALPAPPHHRALLRLSESGFVERSPQGYRLHALFSEILQEALPAEVQRVVREQAPHLPLELKAEAYFRSGLWKELEGLLEQPQALDLATADPSAFLQWSRALPGIGGPWRRLAYGFALCLVGRLQEALSRLENLAQEVETTHPEVAVWALGLVAYHAPEVDLGRALQAVDRGGRLLHRASPRAAARFLNWTLWALWKARRLDRFQAALEEARRVLPPDDPYLFHLVGYNLAFLRWQRDGDLEHYLAWNRRTAEVQERTRSPYFPLTLLQMGRLLLLEGHRAEALECFRRAQSRPGQNFWAEVLAAAWQAYLEQNPKPFERLVALSEADENPELRDILRGLWARTLREGGSPDQALVVSQPAQGFWTALETALSFHALGRQREARGHLPPEPLDREERAFYHAARYCILRSEQDLEALLRLTTLGARILPSLIPARQLPRDRPELADHYPMDEVLRSGWKEAIERRRSEIPELTVEVLGRYRVCRSGEEVHLGPTARALLVCLLLRLDRDAIAENLWPEATVQQARNNLHVQLHHLRRALEPWGVPTYLTPAGLERTRADLWELEAALKRQDAETVLRLYTEPVAPGVDLPAVDDLRRSLQQQVLNLLHRRGKEESAAEGLRYLERVLLLDPLHEPAFQDLLRHLLALGRRQAALQAYREFSDRLERELGVRPTEETEALLSSAGFHPFRGRR
jgi:DNA-binding SARP family transcriptional activator